MHEGALFVRLLGRRHDRPCSGCGTAPLQQMQSQSGNTQLREHAPHMLMLAAELQACPACLCTLHSEDPFSQPTLSARPLTCVLL